MGRPKKEIDEDQVFKLASIGCTYQEIADFFSVDKSTILNRFSHVVKEGHTEVKKSIRRAQLDLAMKGNASMLIWLGKQMLGQRDQPDESSAPVEKITLKKIEPQSNGS